MKNNYFYLLVMLTCAWLFLGGIVPAHGQTKTKKQRKPRDRSYLFFPQPMKERLWRASVGLVFTTTPSEVTEEVRIRVPAVDVHVIRKLNRAFYLTGRLNSQVLQNHMLGGVRWAHPLSDRISFSLGADMGFWFGFLKTDEFNNSGYGWIAYPNASVGYKITNDLLFTFKTEGVYNLFYRTYAGNKSVAYNNANTPNGVGFTLVLEQPFFHQKHFTLGFRALYTDFNWQFWALYETFNRRTFYPQLIFGLIL